MTVFLFVTSYTSMAGAGLIVEELFSLLHLIPTARSARVLEASVQWNYTSLLNILFLILSAFLIARFLKTGGPEMLAVMEAPADHHEMHPH